MLNRYPILNTDDFELSRHAHALQLLSLDPAPKAAKSPVRTVANAFENEDFKLFSFSYSADMTLDAVAENPDYWLAVPVQATPANGVPGRVRLTNGATRLGSPGASDPLHLKGGAQSLGICLKQHVVQRLATTYLGDDVLPPIVFDPTFDLSRSAHRAIGQMLTTIVEEEQANAQTLTDPRHTNSFKDAITAMLLLYCPHSQSARLRVRNNAPAPQDVKRVIDYIRAYPGDDITLADLVAVAGVPGRTLNEHFRAFTGLSPMAYLKRVRLNNARRMLMSGHVHSVTEAAFNCGIYHLGRFSQDYRGAFGETPSDTLNKARRLH